MKAKGLILLVISLVLGLGAVQWIRGLTKNVAQATASIVVAKSNLNFGDHIGINDLDLVKWPTDALPVGAFTKIEEIAGPGQDRVVLRPLEPNEPVLASKVSGTGGKASLSTVIDQNMRAMTIHVNDATGVAGFITPGDRVDIMLTRDDGTNGKESSRTDILLQNVLVRGIDQEANERKEKPTVVKAVTVEVTPADVQKLTLGSNIGTLSLALRNLASSQEVASHSLSVKDLQPDPGPPAASPAPASPTPRPATAQHIEIVRGTESTSYAVKHDGVTAVPSLPRPSKS
jgi:pilus assembly protein CpaB